MKERQLLNASFVFVGGTGGIGLAAAKTVAARGATVLLVGRNPERGGQASQLVRKAGGKNVTFLAADVSTVAGAWQAATQIKAWRNSIHGLVHTARTAVEEQRMTADGFEPVFALQYLARYVLNRALLVPLAASGDGRIIHVGCQAPTGLLPDLDNLPFERREWSVQEALSSAQMLGSLHVQEAAKRWECLPLTVSLACATPAQDGARRARPAWLRALANWLGRSPEHAAAGVVRLLTCAHVTEANGAVLADPTRYSPMPLSHDPVLAGRVWEFSERLVEKRGFQLAELPQEETSRCPA